MLSTIFQEFHKFIINFVDDDYCLRYNKSEKMKNIRSNYEIQRN